MAEPYKMPKPAQKTIAMVMAEFLDDQRARLKPKTFSRYEAIISLFQDCMNGYAYQSLDEAESTLFEQHYNAEGKGHREFCELFGPEKILENVGEFLGYFMTRKVICGKDMMQAAGTVTKKLGRWLHQKGYVSEDDAADLVERGGDAARDLPATEELARLLVDELGFGGPPCEDAIEDHFGVVKVEPGKLHLSAMNECKAVVVAMPREITAACREGWTIAGAVGKVRGKWRLLEVWNVHPY